MLVPYTLLQSRYRIIKPIGSGGMSSAVYLAEDIHLPGYQCAIKEMSPDQVLPQDRSWAVGAFRQEAQMLATLNHPGVVRVSDHFAEYGNWYLVMEYIAGQTLEEYLDSAPRGLPVTAAVDLVDQLCAVLDYLHARTPPVIFRDLKPGNVMLTSGGEVKLIDFGIARFFKSGQGHNTVNLGTPGYASPEHSSGQTDQRSDVYSLAVLLLQLVTGYDPTKAAMPFALPSARTLNPAVPPQIEAVIQRAIQLRPEQRFQSVAEFRQALMSQPVPSLPSQPASSTRVSRWHWIALTILGLMAIGVVVFKAINPTPTPSQPSTPFAGWSQTAAPQASDSGATDTRTPRVISIASTSAVVETPTSIPEADPRALAQQAIERFQKLRVDAQHTGDTSQYSSVLKGDTLADSIRTVKYYQDQGCHLDITDRAPMSFAFEEVSDTRVAVTAQRSETRAVICSTKSTTYVCESYEGYYTVERLADGWYITAKGVRNTQALQPCP